MKMKLSLGLICLMLVWTSVSIAQTLTTDAPAEQKIWEVFLKVMSIVPASLQVVISSILGGLMAGIAGTIDGFPLGVESAATMGVAGGATGQLLANMNPQAIQPKAQPVNIGPQ